MSSFNVILPSDSNKKLYPGNTKSKNKVRLNLPVDLDQRGEWEIGVSDLHVPAKISKSFILEAKLSHPSSRLASATSTLETSTSNLETKLNEVLSSASICETKCAYGVKIKIAQDGTVTLTFVYKGNALSPHEIWNVIFYHDTHKKEGHLGMTLHDGRILPPSKLVLGKELRPLLGLSGNKILDPTVHQKDEILSPFALLPRLDFDFYWYESTKNRDLILPLNLEMGKIEEVHNKYYYVMYMQLANQSKVQAVYIPKLITEGLAGLFITILRYYIRDVGDKIKWVDLNYYPLNGSGKSMFSLYLTVGKVYWAKNLSLYSSLLKIYINEDLAKTLSMSDKGLIFIIFPNYNSELNLGARTKCYEINMMDLMSGTQWEQFSSYQGFYDPVLISGMDRYEYLVSFKVGGKTDPASMKLQEKSNFTLNASVTLPQKYSAQGFVQWCNIHCPNLVQGNVLRGVSRPQSSGDKVMSDIPMRHLHYKKLVPGTKRIQDFDIEFKDEHDEPVTFGPKGKTIMTVNFRPVKRMKLSHFNVNVTCKVKHPLTVPKQLETVDKWEVALMDLSYPEKWKNVHLKKMGFTLGLDRKYETGKSWTRYIDPGYYTPAGLVDWIKRERYIP